VKNAERMSLKSEKHTRGQEVWVLRGGETPMKGRHLVEDGGMHLVQLHDDSFDAEAFDFVFKKLSLLAGFYDI